MKRQRDHLGEVTHGRFAAIALPVRVRGEARRGVEGKMLADRREVLRIKQMLKWQDRLEAQDGVGE